MQKKKSQKKIKNNYSHKNTNRVGSFQPYFYAILPNP